MVQTIMASGDRVQFVAGDSANVRETAKEWVESGFTPSQAIEWWKAGAFDAKRSLNMAEVGLTPKTAAPLAYKYCNGDCDLAEVAKLVE